MAATQKIVLNPSRDIPFNKLVLSQANVRRVKAGVSIEALAQSIARRSLLQSLSVRPVLDAEGNETGMFEVPAGGRRFRALELLVRQKRLARTAPIPCIVKTEGLAEEDSLAENTDREALHPLDQFRAFQTLHARQEQVWATIQRGWNKEPHIIRRMLTEGAVRGAKPWRTIGRRRFWPCSTRFASACSIAPPPTHAWRSRPRAPGSGRRLRD